MNTSNGDKIAARQGIGKTVVLQVLDSRGVLALPRLTTDEAAVLCMEIIAAAERADGSHTRAILEGKP